MRKQASYLVDTIEVWCLIQIPRKMMLQMYNLLHAMSRNDRDCDFYHRYGIHLSSAVIFICPGPWGWWVATQFYRSLINNNEFIVLAFLFCFSICNFLNKDFITEWKFWLLSKHAVDICAWTGMEMWMSSCFLC